MSIRPVWAHLHTATFCLFSQPSLNARRREGGSRQRGAEPVSHGGKTAVVGSLKPGERERERAFFIPFLPRCPFPCSFQHVAVETSARPSFKSARKSSCQAGKTRRLWEELSRKASTCFRPDQAAAPSSPLSCDELSNRRALLAHHHAAQMGISKIKESTCRRQ